MSGPCTELQALDEDINAAVRALDAGQAQKLNKKRNALAQQVDVLQRIDAEKLRQQIEARKEERQQRGFAQRAEIIESGGAEIATTAARVVSLATELAQEKTKLERLVLEKRRGLLDALADITDGEKNAGYEVLAGYHPNLTEAFRLLIMKLELMQGFTLGLNRYEPQSFVEEVTTAFAKMVRIAERVQP